MNMNRFWAVLCVGLAILGFTGPARAELCGKCKDMMFTADIGRCAECGGGTSSGALKLCKACSAKLKQCEHCRASLAVGVPAASTQSAASAATQPAGAGETVAWHGQGEKAGEPTQDSIILLTRLTAVEKGEVECDVPGKDGWARFEVAEDSDFKNITATTEWAKASAENDYTVKQAVKGLKAGKEYFYRVRIADPEKKKERVGPARRFKTALPADRMGDVAFIVITGQGYGSKDDEQGHHAYLIMEKLGLDFIALTGDTVYYDGAAGKVPTKVPKPDGKAPAAEQIAYKRAHWHSMYALPIQREFFGKYAGYWEVDDHDYERDNAARYSKIGSMLFREQNPVPDKTYRTVRWGKALQIWFAEGREFRNLDAKPATIWGKEQFDWLIKSISESDATFKVLVNPTALAGSGDELENKNKTGPGDCHAEKPFLEERKAFFDALKAKNVKNFFIAVGDDHWKYHSRDKETGYDEFCCGALSGKHHGGGGGRWEVTKDPAGLVDFLHPKGDEGGKGKGDPGPGGFLRIVVKAEGRTNSDAEIIFQLYATDGKKQYEYTHRAK